MTDPYTGPSLADDIVEDDGDTLSAQLDRQADAILQNAEARAAGPRPLRQAVREDAGMARDWARDRGRERAVQLRNAVQTEPVRATLYALGLGLVIGLLVAR